MADPNPRDLALQTLNQFDARGIVPRYFLEQSFWKYPRMSERDKALAVHLVNGVLRWRLRLDWYIGQCSKLPFYKIEPRILNILRIAVYQIFFIDRIPDSASVNEAVKQAKAGGRGYLAGFVNGVLRQIVRKKDDVEPYPQDADMVRRLSIKHSFPQWMVRKWIAQLGESRIDALLEASNKIPRLVIRTNTLKTTRDDLICTLKSQGLSVTPSKYSPVGIVVDDLSGPVAALEPFRNGFFQVQSESAQICTLLLGAMRGDTVLDVCAGLGGKASHLAELVGPQGKVIALDIKKGSLLRLMKTCSRLEQAWVHAAVADATNSLEKLFRGRFDKILVDSPCSGLGIISRQPDIKWRRKESHIGELSELQFRILSNAARLLSPGGFILYVTCTISREENEELVSYFLDKYPGMELVDLNKTAPEWARDLIDGEGFFRTYPDIHGINGFFATLMRRKS